MTRRVILKSISAVVALLFSWSAAAAVKVEVVSDASRGTVTSSVDGTVVTLTIAPAEGYYVSKNDISAVKTFMPTMAPRRSPVPIADELTLVGNDPDDLSQPRSYTVTLPGEEYGLLVNIRYAERQRITEQMVRLSETLFVYNEKEQRPTVIIDGLTEGRDFTVQYAEPTSVAAGTYTLTVTGRSTWTGSVTRTYKIFAGGKAEVNNSIAGGTIATAVDGLTVTLTVTPTDGYYVTKKDITLAKTYMPVAAPRRTIPVADLLELTGEDPDDLSLPRTYTAQLPGWEYSVYVDATFTQRQTITSTMVTLSASSFVYNGSDQKPTVNVKGLKEGKDYLLDFEGSSWTDVGTYKLTVTGRSTWKGVISRTYTITKAPSVVTVAPEPLALTYSGAPQALVAAGDTKGGTMLYSLDGSTYQTSLPTGTATGSYTIYYKVQGDSNHTDTEAKTVTATIAKKAITISGIAAQDKVYDGTTAATLVYDQVVYGGIVEGDALSIVATGTFVDANVGTGKTVTLSGLMLGGTSIGNYQLAESGQQITATATITPRSIEGAVFGNIAAQSYSGEALTPVVTVTLDNQPLVGDKDYTVSYADNVNVGEATVTVTGIGNYQDMVQTTFVITPVAAVVTVVPQPQTMVYSGAAQQLVAAGEAVGGTLMYSLDGTTYQAAIPTGVAAGSYTIYYKVQGDANHTDTEALNLSVTIGKKDIVISGIMAQNKVYDGTTAATLVYDQVVYGGIVEGDVLTVTADGAFTDANAGADKTVSISHLTLDGTSIGNYLLASTGQQTATTASITPRSIEGTPVVTVTLDNQPLVGDKDYTVSYADNVNVGEATVTVTGAGNYQGAVQTKFIITPVAAVVTLAPQPQTLIYSGSAQQLVAAGDAEGGTMLYSLDGTDYQESIPTGIAAGSYTIYYKVKGDSNHTDTEVKSVTATITKKAIIISGIAAQNKVYDGTTAATLVYDAVVFGGMAEGDALTVTAIGTFSDANAGSGKVVTLSGLTLGGASIGNYQLAERTPVVTVTLDNQPLVGDKDYTVSYADNVNVGEATVTVTGIGNYQGAVQTKFIITPVSAVVTLAPQPQTLVYSGNAQQLVAAGDAEGGTMLYSLDGTDYQESIPTGVAAGSYTIYYKVQGDSNHTDSNPATVVVTMGSKELSQPTILLSSTSYIYDGTAKEPDVTVMDGETVIPATEYVVTYESNVNAGDAKVIITDVEGGNYIVSGEAPFTIMKADAVVVTTPKALELDYNGEAQVLVSGGETIGGVLVYSLDGESYDTALPIAIEPALYTVYYKVIGDDNHFDTEVATASAVIRPQQLLYESGGEANADIVVDDEGNVNVVINELPEGFFEGTAELPTTLVDENSTEYGVTEVSSEAFNDMPSDVIVVLPENIETTEPVTNVVNGDGTCETIDLTEVKELSLPIDVEVETVVYDREVTNGSTTVCLPYDLPVPENTTAYFLDVTDGEGVTLQEVEGVMEAYQPYVLVVNEQSAAHAYHRTDEASAYVVDLGMTNVTFSHTAEAGSVERDNFTLCGTMHTMTHEEGLAMKAYVLQPDNSWRITASSDPEMAQKPYLAPFQAYLLYTGFGEMDEVATTFDSITTCVQPVKPGDKVSSETGWYDLNGRKLGGKPTRKGVYLHQRKVVVH